MSSTLYFVSYLCSKVYGTCTVVSVTIYYMLERINPPYNLYLLHAYYWWMMHDFEILLYCTYSALSLLVPALWEQGKSLGRLFMVCLVACVAKSMYVDCHRSLEVLVTLTIQSCHTMCTIYGCANDNCELNVIILFLCYACLGDGNCGSWLFLRNASFS